MQRWPLGQDSGVPLHVPFWQVSFCVHGSVSSQEPLVFGGFVQLPVPGWHCPTSWQTLMAVQTTGLRC
ncbi:MAG TPA: hypothetical protein VH374_13560 [Polyangia bacterium]|jgi:hypothetical protein|nr:hypothetical protein [Polyangia bacterium]